MLLRKVVVIKVTIKKATYVDLTEQYKILFIFSIAILNGKRVPNNNYLASVQVMCALQLNLLDEIIVTNDSLPCIDRILV